MASNTELKSQISDFMKDKFGDEIKDSTDLSTVVDEDKVDSTVSALMKKLKITPSATEVTIKKGTTISTLATQLADEQDKDGDSDDDTVTEGKKDKKDPKKATAKDVDDVLKEAAKKDKKDDDDDEDKEMDFEEIEDDKDGDSDEEDDDKEGDDDEGKKKAKKKADKKKDVKEQIETLFAQDETLTEAFKEKAAILFETVLNKRIDEEVDEIRESLEEQYNENLKEAVEAHAEQLHEELDNLTTKIDEYLTYVAEEWMKENELAVEKGVRAEITENFIYGLRNLFAENYIDVPEGKENLVESLEEKTEELQEQVNSHLKRNMRLKKQLQNERRKNILFENSSDMTLAERDQLEQLTESVDFESEEEFEKKIQIIKEHYFSNDSETTVSKKKDMTEEEQFGSQTLLEDYHAEPASMTAIDVYKNAISKIVR
ncbi:MAG: hypothetical protein VW270_00370 [Candidatus Poseidoniales archaeon]